jgi:hypothetical protein
MHKYTKLLGWMPVVAPAAVAVLVYFSWAVAFWQLGRRPAPSMDDPKYIGGLSTQVSSWAWQGILVLLVLWALGMISVAVAGSLPKITHRGWWWRQFALGFAAIVLLVFSARYSPGNAVSWFLD